MREGTNGLQGVLLDEELTVTFTELTRLCGASDRTVRLLVSEGVLHPAGERPQEWRFSGLEVRRARLVMRLQRDLELNLAGAALALDLIEEVRALRRRIRSLERQLEAKQ